MTEITLAAADGTGTFSAYVAAPAHSSKLFGAVVVIQEIFGINEAIRATCHELAAMGFIAIAPDLFWRQQPGVDITDKSAAEWQQASALMDGFDQDRGIADLQVALAAARKYPGGNGKAGTLGFCLGGRLAFMMATRADADVNVSYYGVGLEALVPEVGKVGAPLLVHMAANDEYSSPEAQAAVIKGVAGNANIEAHIYPNVQHAFARVNGVHYDARAATIANGRTAEILAEVLG